MEPTVGMGEFIFIFLILIAPLGVFFFTAYLILELITGQKLKQQTLISYLVLLALPLPLSYFYMAHQVHYNNFCDFNCGPMKGFDILMNLIFNWVIAQFLASISVYLMLKFNSRAKTKKS
jgi:hypothetical protein